MSSEPCMATNSSHLSISSYSLPRLLKTRTGCTTCKTRKIKCDETQPHCQRCQNAGWKCPGYGRPPPGVVGRGRSRSILSTPARLSDLNGRTWRERRSFEYYFNHSGRAIAGPLDTRFWHGIVLQLSRSEPVVWDAVIAISALYEDSDPFLGPPMVMPATTVKSVAKHHEPLGWYFRSMASMRERIGQNRAGSFLCLVTCLLYLCLENMQGHSVEALRLYEQGMRLIRAMQQRPALRAGSYEDTVVKEVIIPMFFRLGASAMVSAGYPVQEDPFMQTANDVICVPTMDSLRAAIISLNMEATMLVKSASEYDHSATDQPDQLQALVTQQETLRLKLQRWKLVFTTFQGGESLQSNPAASVLLTFHIAATIMVSTCLSERQLSFDDHTSQFRRLVHHARIALTPASDSDRQPHRHTPFTFETGPGLPLYYAVIRCRDPTLRREALALLKQTPQVQAFFKCPSWIRLADMAIRLEEGDMRGMHLKMQIYSYSEHTRLTPSSPGTTTYDDLKPQEWLAIGDLSHDTPIIHEVVGIADVDEACFLRPQTNNSESMLIPEEQRLSDIGVMTAYRCEGAALDRSLFDEDDRDKATLLRQMKGEEEVFFQFTRNRLDAATGSWKQDRFFLAMD
ncbi:Zn(II)2Cys6 transcription factor domain-containing protein [Aspergillus melleus]|uniref:Zn(II)2Cys6 transcription factor domain-containing protein n=1 Tax=Aspergillus melleus TaxID=138277 RepID=UPI001E8D8C30|nr:uncharacterized protein LDX57_011070 [Aspergillus melleus]KAH8433436.1 hypothetical protein LDX57_011070 [Aspergillus melleus]